MASSISAVETIAPVNTDEAKHGEVEAHTDACRVIHLERLELREGFPAVAAFDEAKEPNGGAATLNDGLAEFEGKTVEDRTATVGSKGVVLVATQGDDLATIKHP